jgi:hypothetical protein
MPGLISRSDIPRSSLCAEASASFALFQWSNLSSEERLFPDAVSATVSAKVLPFHCFEGQQESVLLWSFGMCTRVSFVATINN